MAAGMLMIPEAGPVHEGGCSAPGGICTPYPPVSPAVPVSLTALGLVLIGVGFYYHRSVHRLAADST